MHHQFTNDVIGQFTSEQAVESLKSLIRVWELQNWNDLGTIVTDSNATFIDQYAALESCNPSEDLD